MDRRTVYITIIVSVLLHIAVLYYVAVTWGIVPNVLEEPTEEIAVLPATTPERATDFLGLNSGAGDGGGVGEFMGFFWGTLIGAHLR